MQSVIEKIVAEKANFIAKSTGEEIMLVPLKNNVADLNQFLTLNEVGSFLWENMQKTDSVQSLTTKVCSAFEAGEEEVRADIVAFLGHLESFILHD